MQENPATSIQSTRLNYLEHSGHPHSIGAELLQHPDLGRGFVLRTHRRSINTLTQCDPNLACRVPKTLCNRGEYALLRSRNCPRPIRGDVPVRLR